MSSLPPLTPERADLAGEYALGLLDGDDLAAARAALRDDPTFRAEVAGWNRRLAPLLDEVAPADPPVAVLDAIEARIAAPIAANDDAPVLASLVRSRNRWRMVGGGSTALAAALALVLLTAPPREPLAPPTTARPPMVAMIDGEGSNHLVATWNANDRSLVVAAAATMAGDPAHSHELWVIPADGTPRSMGVMPAGAPMRLTVPAPMLVHLAEGATLAVSVEPLGGSPSGAPTGPVIASGALRSI